MSDAVVVGAGPNGLAAAVTLADAGVRVTVLEAAGEIGGSTRSGELTLPGLLHDYCSAVHPMAVASPFFASLDLAAHGVEWRHPELDLAHPLAGGDAAVLVRQLAGTAEGLGADGPAWQRLFDPLTSRFDRLTADLLRPVAHVPAHPGALLRYGVNAALPVTSLVRRFRTERARALFAGIAAHGYHPLRQPASSAIGLMLTAAAHRHGWPVARGGSRTITGALAAILAKRGGTIETNARVTSLADLPHADAVLFDLTPAAVAGILGDRLPTRVARAYRRYRPAPAAFKLDLAVADGIPWTAEACRRAGTVHVGGTVAEIAHAEREINRGRLPARPFVLVAQQYLADPERSRDGIHPVWAYGHVPHGYSGDASDAILAQLERFAPGLRERIVAMSVRGPAALARHNPNLAGGDIIGGANTPWQLAVRPRLAVDPYATGVPGFYLCSAATPPGTGVHGMCGHNAARSALRHLDRG